MRQRYATIRPGWFIARLPALIAVIVALALAAAQPRDASAHARLVASNPPSGTALASVPAELALTFSEAIDPAYSSASLPAADDAPVPLGPLGSSPDGLTLVVPVADPSAVPPGTYTLVWRVLSAVDGHVTTGTVAFSAGTASRRARSREPRAPAPPRQPHRRPHQEPADGDLHWSITNGLGGTEMSAHDPALTEQERWDLVNDLRAVENDGRIRNSDGN